MAESADIFLSYSREDQAIARRFAVALERAGFSVWWDQTLIAGEAFDEATERALEGAGAVVVLWSKKSVASRWVRAEATQANERGKLVPVMIESCKRPIMFELTHTADLSQWNGDTNHPGWLSLLAGVRGLAGKSNDSTTLDPGAGRVATARPIKRPAVWALALAALVVMGVAVFWLNSRKVTEQPSSQPAAAAAQAEPVALAVLPFVNLSSDPEQEYFSDGLTEEILNQLAQVRQLRVTGRTSSFSFKGRNEDLREIGRQLGVAHLLEGSVRKDGNSLRITAQLIDARDGAHQWSKTYARERKDVFAVQEEIARDVATALSITLDVGEMSRAKGGTTNVEAHEQYLRALSHLPRRDMELAVPAFRRAVTLDPDFALAWFGLYNALPILASMSPELTAALLPERESVKQRLVTLVAKDGWMLRRIRADEALVEHRWEDALREFSALQALTPNDADLNVQHMRALRSVGRYRESIAYAQRSVQGEPLNYDLLHDHVRVLRTAGLADETKAELQRGSTLSARPPFRAFLELWLTWPGIKGDADTRARLAAFLRQFRDSPMGLQLSPLVPDPDDEAAIRVALRRALENPAYQSEGPLAAIAMVADMYGDRQANLAALHRSYVDLPSGFVPNIWERSIYSGARAEPGFKDLLRKLDIVDYYRSSGNWGDFCKPVGVEDFECH